MVEIGGNFKMGYPVVVDQRFLPIHLDKLMDVDSIPVQEYVSGKGLDDIIEDIITGIRYPMKYGQPDDSHTFNCFSGTYKWCRTIKLDFWQKASETLTFKVGDCEDSSIAFATSVLGITESAYEIFGVVRDGITNQILGGHGWNLFFDSDKDVWRLYESTLDSVPDSFPVVKERFKPFYFEGLIYDPYVVWNIYNYEEIKPFMEWKDVRLGNEMKKFRAIEKAWNRKTKAIKNLGLLGKIREKLSRD